MGPQFKLTTMLELEPFSDEEIPHEQNMQMLQDYYDTAAEREKAWQRQRKGYKRLMKIKFDQPSVSVTQTELQLEETQHIQLGKRPRSASVTDTELEEELEESIPSQPNKRPCVYESTLISAAEEPILISAAEEPILIYAAEEPILISKVEDNDSDSEVEFLEEVYSLPTKPHEVRDSDSEVEFLEEVYSLPTKPHEVGNTYNMVKFIGKSNQDRFDIKGEATQYIIDVTCRLLGLTNLYAHKAIVSSERILQMSNVVESFGRQVQLMKELIGGSETAFIPCLELNHWTLVILFTTVKDTIHTRRVVVVDSWKPPGHQQKIGKLARTVAKAASKAMWDETVQPKLAKNPSIQANNYDCGYFVLENIIWGCADFAGLLEELDGKWDARSQSWISSNKVSLGDFYRKAAANGGSLELATWGFVQYLSRHYASLSNRATFGEGWTSSDISDVSE